MGRRPKTRPEVFHGLFGEVFSETETNWLPENAKNLKVIILALLKRIEETSPKSPKEAHFLKTLIREITLQADPRLPFDHETRTNLQRATFFHIRFTKYPREPHYTTALHHQRSILLKFFDEKQYKPKSPGPQEEWLKIHSKAIYDLLGVWWCACQYPESLDGIFSYKNTSQHMSGKRTRAQDPFWAELDSFHSEFDEIKNIHLLTINDAVVRILAFLHQTTPSQIENLLKPTPYFRRRRS